MSESRRRAAAVAVFVVTGVMSAVTVVLHHQLFGDPRLADPTKPMDIGFVISGNAVAVAALLLIWARPYNAIGWLLGLAEFLGALCDFAQHLGAQMMLSGVPGGALAMTLSAPLWVPGLFIPATLVLSRYPSGKVVGRWARRVDRAVVVGFVALWLGYASADSAVSDEIRGGHSAMPLPPFLQAPLMIVAALGVLGGGLVVVGITIRRLVRARGAERYQLAWLFTTSILAVLLVMVSPWDLLGSFAFAMIPIAIAVGVLRYNLLGIDLVVRRTVLYVLLTAGVLAVFVATTAGLAALLPSGPAPQVVAASLVAVGLVPARDRLQKLVDRFVYGDRGDPLAALSRLSAPVTTVTDDDLLVAVVSAVRDGLRTPGVAVVRPDGTTSQAGELTPGAPSFELRLGDRTVGQLLVAPRRGQRTLSAGDEEFLAALAPVIAVVVQSVDLAVALRRERQRVVEATRDERARLRRDLHDGLGPSLTGIGLGLEALESAAVPSGRGAELLTRLRAETASALDEVRRIIDDLRPGAFETGDLVTVLRSKAQQVSSTSGLHVKVQAVGSLDCLTPEVENAALRIVDEALTNVLRHAQATRCWIEISCGPQGLDLSIVDDGVGFAGLREGGVGVPSMRARAEGLGGQLSVDPLSSGTRVSASLPAASST